MKWFDTSKIKTLEDLKKAYRRLAMKHHPDIGGNTADMQEINNEYDRLFALLKDKHNTQADAGHGKRTDETPDDYKRIIEILIHLDGLEIELCGSWLWIGGNTKAHKDALKAAGCQWCRKKKLWSWHPAEERRRYRKGGKDMSYIRSKYGSQKIKEEKTA